MLENPEFVKYEDMVPCIAHVKKTHGEHEVVVDAKAKTTKKVCDIFPSIPCEVHTAMCSVPLEHSYTPASFICGTDGAPLVKPDDAKGWDRSVMSLTKKLGEVQQKLGRPVPRGLYDRVVHDCEQADKDLADGKFAPAVKAIVKDADDKKLPAALRDGRVKEKAAALDAKGGELLEEAKSKRDGAPDEALKLAKKVAGDFKGLDVGKKAAELVKDWEAAGKK